MSIDYIKAVGVMEEPYKLINANSGEIYFSLITSDLRSVFFSLKLLRKKCAHQELYIISLGANNYLSDIHTQNREYFVIPNLCIDVVHKFWITWYNDVICMGKINGPAFLKYPIIKKQIIGFVKFQTRQGACRLIEWNVECPSIVYAPMTKPKQVNGGELTWVKMNSTSKLPIDALIGGIENEPLYIARAEHRGSLCPGKYVKSKQLAYVPWGGDEIEKDEFEVLCGYNAMWVKSCDSRIPENAFIGGYSEVRREPLFIGRAWVRNSLLVGKVHLLYKTCYLPFQQKEVEVNKYETLVNANKITHGDTRRSVCYMNMVRQPCLD